MVLLDNLIQQCVDFVLPAVISLVENSSDVISRPLNSDAFATELLQFQWNPLLENEDLRSNVDMLIDMVLKRIVTDSLMNENDESSNLQVRKCAVVLDFCFHSKISRKEPVSWSVSYFDLLSTAFDMLNWPSATLEFWPYVNARMHWFKMGNSLNPVLFGETNLISYKQPLYDKLRHWNDLLKKVHNNSSLNTPLDNIMSYKLIKFLSELLPIHEESNFNRSAVVSTRQGSGNPWNKTISSATKRDDSSENVFAMDYNYVFDNLLVCPLEFAYRSSEHKADLDTVLVSILDSIFDAEEEFYKRVKESESKLSDINEKINYRYPCDFGVTDYGEPNYMKHSAKIKEERSGFWHKIWSMEQSDIDIPQPTLLDISISNPDALYMQMMEIGNDFYRKQFLLQLYFTVNVVRQIVTVPVVENYYKICYQKEKPSRSINFDNLDESNRKKTLSLCNHILENRIIKFYHNRDPAFSSLIQKLANKDKIFLEAKVDGFKTFQNFKIPAKPVNPPTFNYGFKKFGFIEMGNKLVSNVWKIKTGLDCIERRHESPKELYDTMHEKFNKGEVHGMNNEKEPENKIIKEWQCLRSLRSQYLFEFNKVDENVGINGLFDPSLMEAESNRKNELIKKILLETERPHIAKLEEARAYIAQKQNRKKVHGAELEPSAHKKMKVAAETEENQKASAMNDLRQISSDFNQTKEPPHASPADESTSVEKGITGGKPFKVTSAPVGDNGTNRELLEQKRDEAREGVPEESPRSGAQNVEKIILMPATATDKEGGNKVTLGQDSHDIVKSATEEGDKRPASSTVPAPPQAGSEDS